MRYLKARAEHVPSNKPTAQVDIGEMLRSQREWATNTPARGTKEDTAAAERYAQRADPPYQQQQPGRPAQQAPRNFPQQEPLLGVAAAAAQESDQPQDNLTARKAQAKSHSRGPLAKATRSEAAKHYHSSTTSQAKATTPRDRRAAQQRKTEGTTRLRSTTGEQKQPGTPSDRGTERGGHQTPALTRAPPSRTRRSGTQYGGRVPEHARWDLVGGLDKADGALATTTSPTRWGDGGGIQNQPL